MSPRDRGAGRAERRDREVTNGAKLCRMVLGENNMLAALFIGSSVLGALATAALPPGSHDRGRIGTGAGDFYPPVVLPSLDGKRAVALSQFAGKKVLLIQFASW